MDVRCERCETEYEFDDALVSGKGTSVKCTHCGHQFRIQGAGSDDKWLIETASGKSMTFGSMRELQRAIASRTVTKDDTLIRANTRRMLGDIVELVPFFEQPAAAKKTLMGHGDPETARAGELSGEAAPQAKRSSGPPPPLPKGAATLMMEMKSDSPPAHRGKPELDDTQPAQIPGANGSSSRPRRASIPPPVPVRSRTATLRPIDGVAPPPMPQVKRLREVETPEPPESDPESTQRFERDEREHARAQASARPRPPPPDIHVPDTSSPLPPPTRPRVRRPNIQDDYDDEGAPPKLSRDLSEPESRRRGAGGYIVAIVLVAAIGAFGVYWTKTHPGVTSDANNAPAGSASAALDARAQEFLSAGDRALVEGNLDLAREKLDKASALAEKDPRVLVAEARLENASADIPWLRLRILSPDAKDDAILAKKDLEEAVSRAKKAADDAAAADPSSTSALRARVDAYRIAGDKTKATPLAGELAGKPKDGENAYALAMVDLIDPQNAPLPTTLTRLREASEVDASGRARAALVYSLALSGDVASAKTELDRLAARDRPHPLTSALRAFVARSPEKKATPSAGGITAVDPASLPVAQQGGTSGGTNTGGGSDAPLVGDSRSLVSQGDSARQRGDTGRARKAFEAALEKNPYDSEALSGLAEVARAEHNMTDARAEFKRAIAVNPRYLPALVGLGDVEWESGDQSAAQRQYKEIVDNYPDVAYPPRVKERAAYTAPTPPPPPVQTATQATATAPPQPPQPPEPPKPAPEGNP